MFLFICDFVLNQAVGEIQNKIEERKDLLASWGLTLQPFVFLVGKSDEEISVSYAVVDCVFYLCDSPLGAVDLCLKAAHAVHTGFSKEVSDLWLLLQSMIWQVLGSLIC